MTIYANKLDELSSYRRELFNKRVDRVDVINHLNHDEVNENNINRVEVVQTYKYIIIEYFMCNRSFILFFIK